MSDPADKSDDLIAELAKLMATPPGGGNQPSVAPIAKAAPLDLPANGAAAAPAAPIPIRIPGMEQPRPATPTPVAPAASAAPPPRAPVTGAIRIPGMDNPAPVATSVPVSKFDFGAKPAAAAPLKQEPLSTLAERLAPQNPAIRVEPKPVQAAPQAAPTPIRIPSDLKPVSENRSFGSGPTLSVSQPAAAPIPAPQPQQPPPAPANGGDFGFDFGFGRTPASVTVPGAAAPEKDPIADLIASSMGDSSLDANADDRDNAPAPQPVRPVPVAQFARPQVQQVQATQKPAMAPAAPPRPSNSQPIPLKPVSVAPRSPEVDRFAFAPGSGLDIKPMAVEPLGQPTQRSAESPKPVFDNSDPMSEIESLIGDAVRVELSPPGPVKVQAVQQKVSPRVAIESDFDLNEDGDLDEIAPPKANVPAPAAPVVPPLNSNFAPRRAGLKDEPSQTSAEDAILAAAAASGAKVDHVEPSVTDESPYRRLKVKPARSSFSSGGIRQYVGMAVAGTLLLAAGLGLYWVLNMGRANTLAASGDNAPQLTADATPVKELPSAPTADETDAARSPVLEQMAGTSVEPSAEQLVSTDDTTTTPVTRDVTNVAAAEDTEGGLANRKVRTVTVRPDGTIVSGDDAVAGAEELPVDRPNVPAVPTSDTTNLLGDTTSVAMTDPAAENTALTGTVLPPANTTTSAEPLTAEAAIEPIANAGGIAPKPIAFPVRREVVSALVPQTDLVAETDTALPELTGAQTPNGQIDLLGGEIQQPTRVAAADPAPVNSGGAGAYVQLSSSPSEADAQASARSLNNKFGNLFGGNQLVVQSADLGQKGTWYRVRLPTGSLSEAQSTCAAIKANGGDCIVSGG